MNFKIQSKGAGLVVAVNAEGAIVNVSVRKHPLTFLKLNKLAVGTDVDINVTEAINPANGEKTGNLMCTDYAKTDMALVAALQLAAKAATAEGQIARAARMATADIEENLD